MFHEELGSTRWSVKDDAVKEGNDDYVSLYVHYVEVQEYILCDVHMRVTFRGLPVHALSFFGRGGSGDISGTWEEVCYACHHGQSK